MAKQKQKKKEVTTEATVRTSAGMRDSLFDELEALRGGSSSPARANAISKLCGTVIDTVRMEIEVQKHSVSMTQRPEKKAKGANMVTVGVPLSLGA